MGKRGPKPVPWEQRFVAKVKFGAPDECWPWLGSVPETTGYGRFGVAAGDVRDAHRIAFELWVGPIPDGFQIDHVRAWGCTLRHCVNPHHLEAVTQRENLIRGDGWAGTNSRRTECPRGHAYTKQNTRIHHGRRECRTCDNNRSRLWRRRQKVAA